MIRSAILGSLMVVVILLLRLILGKRLPKGCFRLLWLLAAIRFVVPFAFAVEVEVPPKADVYAEQRQGTVIDTAQTVRLDTVSRETVSQAEPSANPITVIRAIHILGTALCGGFMVIAYIRMRRLALDGKPLPKDITAKWGKVTVLCGSGFEAPFSCGAVKPVIFLPNHMQKLEPKQLDAVIAHEKQHIRSGDQLLKWLLCAAVCLHWYNPLAWVMLRFASRDIELACDEGVLRRLGGKSDYALTLIAAEEIRQTASVCSFGAPVLNERIEFIMRSKKTTICGFIAAGVVLAMMTAFFVSVNAVEREAEEDTRIVSPDTDSEAGQTDDANCEVSDEVYEETTVVVAIPDFVGTAENEIVYEDDCITTVEVLAELLPAQSETVEFISPIETHYGISGKFGSHTNPAGISTFNVGVNVKAGHGEPINAAASGTVTYVGYDSERGFSVSLDHGNGYETLYNHCRVLYVGVGDLVEAGELIAEVGATGTVTGPNLGFAIIADGAYIDPTPLFE